RSKRDWSSDVCSSDLGTWTDGYRAPLVSATVDGRRIRRWLLEQCVEVPGLGTLEERPDLTGGVDESGPPRVARVAYGDVPVRKSGDLHAVSVRVAPTALGPDDLRQAVRGNAVVDLHLNLLNVGDH